MGCHPVTPNHPQALPLWYATPRNRIDWEGKVFIASTLYEAWNGKIQAVALKLPKSLPCQIETPHISISWCDGVKPYESNTMLASEFDSQIIVSTYKFKIEFLEWTTV